MSTERWREERGGQPTRAEARVLVISFAIGWLALAGYGLFVREADGVGARGAWFWLDVALLSVCAVAGGYLRIRVRMRDDLPWFSYTLALDYFMYRASVERCGWPIAATVAAMGVGAAAFLVVLALSLPSFLGWT